MPKHEPEVYFAKAKALLTPERMAKFHADMQRLKAHPVSSNFQWQFYWEKRWRIRLRRFYGPEFDVKVFIFGPFQCRWNVEKTT